MNREIRTYLNLKLALVALFFLAEVSAVAQFYRGSHQEFGKNRLQFDEFNWNHYDFQQFNVYFYGTGNNLAVHSAKVARETIREFEKRLDYRLNNKFYIIVFNNQSDWRQTNIGLRDGDEQNIGGVTRIEGNKLFLYFEGDHDKLNLQIRAGMAEIFIRHMMFGENWKEMIKNSALLTLPDWYVDGLVSYLTEPWSVKIDNQMRDAVVNGRFKKFNRLSGKDAQVAGHSLWYYIAEIYGQGVIPNILFMARISRNVESGFLHVLGISLDSLIDETLGFYENKYQYDEQRRGLPPNEPFELRTKKSRVYQDFKMSSSGNQFAYVTNELGQYKVWLGELNNQRFEKKRKPKIDRILKGGYKLDRLPDLSYPMLSWHPGGEILGMMLEKKGEIEFLTYNVVEKEWETFEMRRIEKILDFEYAPNGREIVISGIRNGQTDLFVFKTLTKSMEQLTYDIYDDLNPRFIDGGDRIIFSSNRPNDTLRNTRKEVLSDFTDNHDLYIFDYEDRSELLTQVTTTDEVDERYPLPFKEDEYLFLSEENGVRNRYLAQRDSAISRIDTTIHYRYFTNVKPLTNYKRNILSHDIDREANKLVEMLYLNGEYRFFQQSTEAIRPISEIKNTTYQEKTNDQDDVDESDKALETANLEVRKVSSRTRDEKDEVNIDSYEFEVEKQQKQQKEKFDPPKESSRFIELKQAENPPNVTTEKKFRKSKSAPEELQLPQRVNYRTAYLPTEVTTQFDFDFANQLYQRFNGGPFVNPGMGTVLKVGVLDLLEDYKIEGGMRYSFNGNNTEFFFSFNDRKHRLDKKYVFQRQTLTQQANQFTLNRLFIHQVKAIFKWPFSETLALQGTVSARNDRNVTLSTDRVTLGQEDNNINWLGSKVELIFDNTRDKGLNLYNGSRYKIFAETYFVPQQEKSDMVIFGVDFRHYQKIHRDLIFAGRFAGSSNIGNRKLVYYMGAVDNWVVLGDQARFNNETTIAQDQNYYFQTIATNMRGFIQNIRNGNSFAVVNAELRWPVFKYFMRKPIKSDFIKNFQLVGFSDVGTAWTGPSPYSEENAFNTREIERGPVKAILDNNKEPIVGSYGLGVRSKLLGYFVRIDYAWGVEDGIVRDPMTHFSLGMDF